MATRASLDKQSLLIRPLRDDALQHGRLAKHVVLYIPDLSAGGAERVAINLADALSAPDVRVTLLVNRRKGPLLETISSSVRLVSLDAKRTATAFPGLMRFMRRERPDVVIASLPFNNLIAIWANVLARRPTRVVATMHNVLSRQARYASLKQRLIPTLYKATLSWADHIIAVSQGVGDDLASFLGRDFPTSAIHNPIVSPRLIELSRGELDHPWFTDGSAPVILGVGRLVPQKNFALLIDAFAELRRQRAVRLAILGDGPLRQELADRIKVLGLDADAQLLGTDSNPWRYMARAGLVAMSSETEGFGNVLVEAMATGTPVVSTDCPTGPAEILGNGRWGILVPSATPESFAQAMADTLDRPIAPALLRQRAIDFSSESVAESYRDLIHRLCDGVSAPRPRVPAAVDA